MRTRSKLLLAALAAVALFGLAVQSASANRLSLQEKEKGFKIVWNPLTLEAAGAAARCPVTLEGTYELNTLAKRAGTRIGAVTRASVKGTRATGECTGGEATVLTASLPWGVTYQSFTGTLPNIRTIELNLIGASFNVHLDGLVTCLAVTRAEQPAKGIATVEASGHITALRADETAEIETTGGFFCGFSKAHFGGAGTATGLEGGAGPTLKLI